MDYRQVLTEARELIERMGLTPFILAAGVMWAGAALFMRFRAAAGGGLDALDLYDDSYDPEYEYTDDDFYDQWNDYHGDEGGAGFSFDLSDDDHPDDFDDVEAEYVDAEGEAWAERYRDHLESGGTPDDFDGWDDFRGEFD